MKTHIILLQISNDHYSLTAPIVKEQYKKKCWVDILRDRYDMSTSRWRLLISNFRSFQVLFDNKLKDTLFKQYN